MVFRVIEPVEILQYLPQLPESLKEFHKCFIECSSTKHKDIKGNTIRTMGFVLQKRLDCLKLYLKMAYIPLGKFGKLFDGIKNIPSNFSCSFSMPSQCSCSAHLCRMSLEPVTVRSSDSSLLSMGLVVSHF